jgi:S-DNA-T family DNA segregation ATPase FtsK/SpoIIIE
MARRERKPRKDPLLKRVGVDAFMNLTESTRKGIGAVAFFVISAFMLFAAFGRAGFVGTKTFAALGSFLGIGYYFLPAILITLGVLFLIQKKDDDDERGVALVQIISAGVLFLSILGLINIALAGKGGFLGGIISQPLVSLFDVTVTTIILIGVVSVSVLAMFDEALNLHMFMSLVGKLFKKNEDEDTKKTIDEDAPVKITGVGTDEYMSARAAEAKRLEANEKQKVAPLGDEEMALGFGSKKGAAAAGFRLISQKTYTPPPLDLLEQDKGKPGVGDIKANSNIVKRTLQNFGIDVEMDEISIGPSVTRYALKPAEGVKLARIVALQNDLALALAAQSVRIEAPIPGKSLVGIEIPNTVKTTVGLGTLVGSTEFAESDKPLLIALGKGVTGRSHFANIGKMPHLLVAGSTGSGKSVTIHTIITSLLYRNSPEHLKFIMIDPKRVELTLYNSIPHLLTPVITDAKKTIMALKWAAKEMDRRYDVLEKEKVRDIDSYHKNILAPQLEKLQKNGGKKIEVADELSGDTEHGDVTPAGPETMPYIIIIIDELADIMQSYPRELEASIVRLAQMSRAVGIHLILSTQRPSVNVITGLIKANIPTRLALQVTSQIDSRTILDGPGAEKLLGAGDMLFQSADMAQPSRIQSAFISEREVKNVVDFLKKQYEDELMPTIDVAGEQKSADSDATFDSFGGDSDDDELYEEAREIVIQAGKASTSFLQRKLRIGYARAARLIDILEERGVVSAGSGAKPRDVLIHGGESAPQSTEEEHIA